MAFEGLERPDASGSDSVGGCDRRLRGGFWRDLFAENLRFP